MSLTKIAYRSEPISASHIRLDGFRAAFIPQSYHMLYGKSKCFACNIPLKSKFLKALGNFYHTKCFNCVECGDNLAERGFYPDVDVSNTQASAIVPLCRSDYTLRRSYFVCHATVPEVFIVVGELKYHARHFQCRLCSSPLREGSLYYMDDGRIYYDFHYRSPNKTSDAAHCGGCD